MGADELIATGVTAGSYGASTTALSVTVDEDGRITAVATSTIPGTTDDQNLLTPTLSGGSLTLAIEDGASTTIDLSTFFNSAFCTPLVLMCSHSPTDHQHSP